MVTDPISVILEHEGGFVDHPADRGGPTNFGITQSTLSSFLGRPATIDDVKNLTKAQAREIYEKNYIYGPGFDLLPDPPRLQVIDIGVNSGPGAATKMLQRLVNALGFGPVSVDGVCGPKTRDAVKRACDAMGGALFNNALVEERIDFYENIVRNRPNQKVFLNGWMNRAKSFRIDV